jgi:hypothetical protein
MTHRPDDSNHFTESNENRSHDDGWRVDSSSGLTGLPTTGPLQNAARKAEA